MDVKENYPLKKFNSFGISALARYYTEIESEDNLLELLNSEYANKDILVLGGGSNILFTKDFDGLVLKINIDFIDKIAEDDTHVWMKIGAGVVWHEFVLKCLDLDLGGIENLSLIPGTLGAAPMQNIGAYGAELIDVFEELEAINLETLEIENFDKDRCEFGYRDSIFKKSEKNKFIITNVTLKLNKIHEIKTSYGAIEATLADLGVKNPTIRDISNVVIKIRQSKLPDPAKIGNAGSFFKNVVIDKIDYEYLSAEFPNIPGFKVNNDKVKIPSAWLIEQCGWKGKRREQIGVHKDQALVLVNYGNGSGKDLKELALEIKNSVIGKFGIELTTEVNIF